MKNINKIEPLDVTPSVNLIALHSGEVVYQSQVGTTHLAKLLVELAQLPDFPLERQEYQMEDLGQEIYQTSDKEFLLALRGSFATLTWDRANQLATCFTSEGLTFSFVISY